LSFLKSGAFNFQTFSKCHNQAPVEGWLKNIAGFLMNIQPAIVCIKKPMLFKAWVFEKVGRFKIRVSPLLSASGWVR
jgi:hypothetical protein